MATISPGSRAWLLLIVLACSTFSACNSSAFVPGHASLQGEGILGPTAARVGHVYVTDFQKGHGALVQFDVKDGFAVAPARILVRGLHEPLGVAVGPDGLVYVAEAGYGYHAIDVYRVTNGNAQLIRKITFAPGFGPEPEFLAVDYQDYLYASMDNTNVAVFKPGEHGYVQNPHYLQNTGGAFKIGVDRLGDVYQPGGDHSYVHVGRPGKFAQSRTRPLIPRGAGWDYSVITLARADGDELFIGVGNYEGPALLIGVIPIHAWGRVVVGRSLALEGGCALGIFTYGFSIAVANGHLYETCDYERHSGKFVRGIWTYPTSGPKGVVHPLHFAPGPLLVPGDIALGP